MLTEEEFKSSLPKQMQKRVNPDLIDSVNLALKDQVHADTIKENMLSYTGVMRDGKFKLESYINAVKYISFKLMGDTNIKAYSKTFPDKFVKWKLAQVSDKDISSYITAYNKSKLVNLIYEQTLIPTYILNADIYQKAINTQAELMTDLNISPKVRSDAANSILNHLKRPEASKVEISVGVKDDGMVADLKRITANLADQQKKLMEQGTATPKDIAQQVIVETTAVDVTNED